MTRERFAAVVILTHFAAAVVHGIAHGVLAVPAGGGAGLLVIAAAVYVGPLIALVALFLRRRMVAGPVLSASMAAALAYGLAMHYMLHTPDKAAYASPGFWGLVFRVSAVAIAVLEAGGVVAGVLLMRSPLPARASSKKMKGRSGSAGPPQDPGDDDSC